MGNKNKKHAGKVLIAVLLFFAFISSFSYARVYGSDIYGSRIYPGYYCGDGACNNGETCESCSADCGACTTPDQGGGASGGGSVNAAGPVYECSGDSDCPQMQYCFNHTCMDAECFDDSQCKAEKGEVCVNYKCITLFDLAIINLRSSFEPGSDVEILYFVKSVSDSGSDVEIHFWIEKDLETITSGHDTVYVEKGKSFTKAVILHLPENIPPGQYLLKMKLVKGRYSIGAHRTIYIKQKKAAEKAKEPAWRKWAIIEAAFIALLALILVLFIIIVKRKRKGRHEETGKKKIRRKFKLSDHLWQIKIGLTALIFIASFAFLIYVLNLKGIIRLDYVLGAAVSFWRKITIGAENFIKNFVYYWQYAVIAVLAVLIASLLIFLYKARNIIFRKIFSVRKKRKTKIRAKRKKRGF